MIVSRWTDRARLGLWAALLVAGSGGSMAGEVRLKNGVTIKGNPVEIESLVTGPRKPNLGPVPNYPIIMLANPLQRTFVPRRQVLPDGMNKDVELSAREVFRLKQARLSGGTRVIGAVGHFLEKPEAFTEFGRRTVKLAAQPADLSVIQGVTEITPEYLKIEALNYAWETGLATSSVPVDVLDAMLRKASPTDDAEHRLKIARFYIQSELYGPAQRELAEIARDFPDQSESVRRAQLILAQAVSQELLGELKLRRAAGQHRFVYEASKAFPVENVATAVLREVREITAEYESAHERAQRLRVTLADLQARLEDDPRVEHIGARRSEIAERLNFTNLPRLDAFASLADDTKLKPDEKLALALSGWVTGSAHALTELNQALRLWEARDLLLEYLRTTNDGQNQRNAARERLLALEGIGAAQVARLVPLLPPALDAGGAEPGQVARIAVSPAKADVAVAYHVLLPPEYHADHLYPLVVALHGNNRAPQEQIGFWGGAAGKPGQSQRHGYIVIAPEYTVKAGQRDYDYSPVSHRIVIDSLRDARRRFSVDSDRIYLAGHDMGGDAAFDMGLSHPGLFAGVIPLGGVSDRHCQFYWEHARHVPLYVVSGELDRDTVARNAKELSRMMLQGFDLIYTEYVGAGPDTFYSEIHKLFDWMGRHRRGPLPRQMEVKTLRETDNRFFWYELEGIPDGVKQVDWEVKKRVAPMKIMAKINEGNGITIQAKATRHRIWLSPGLIDFENAKRLTVTINGNQRWNDFPQPDVPVLLEHVRVHGDRQQLFWAMLEF